MASCKLTALGRKAFLPVGKNQVSTWYILKYHLYNQKIRVARSNNFAAHISQSWTGLCVQQGSPLLPLYNRAQMNSVKLTDWQWDTLDNQDNNNVLENYGKRIKILHRCPFENNLDDSKTIWTDQNQTCQNSFEPKVGNKWVMTSGRMWLDL